MGWKTSPRADVVQDKLPGTPFACARAGLDRSRVSAFSRLVFDQCGRPARSERVDVPRYMRVCGFMDQERKAARRRGYEGGEPRGGGRVAEDGKLSGRGE
jgi:hypothetical protein